MDGEPPRSKSQHMENAIVFWLQTNGSWTDCEQEKTQTFSIAGLRKTIWDYFISVKIFKDEAKVLTILQAKLNSTKSNLISYRRFRLMIDRAFLILKLHSVNAQRVWKIFLSAQRSWKSWVQKSYSFILYSTFLFIVPLKGTIFIWSEYITNNFIPSSNATTKICEWIRMWVSECFTETSLGLNIIRILRLPWRA
jgi:hypothetical protein